MYLHVTRNRSKSTRHKSSRLRGKLKAKNRRRVNRMHGRKLGRRLVRNG